jgi:hypothetical protein
LLVDAYEPNANFVSARSIEVEAPPQRIRKVLPELPVALGETRWASVMFHNLYMEWMLRELRRQAETATPV